MARLKDQLIVAETREAERIGRIALKAGLGLGGARTILAGDSQDYSVQLDNLGNIDAPYTFFQVGVPQLGTNYLVYNLPYLTFSSDVSGQPSNLASSANANVPYDAISGITERKSMAWRSA